MPIKLKILIPMVFFTILSGVTILISNIVQFSDYIDTSVNSNIHEAAAVSASEIETLKSRVSIASLYMALDPQIIAAMESGERDALITRSKSLQAATGVGFCTIADASGIAIARPHNPESYGDDVTGMPSVQSALSGKSLTAIEEGVSVRMSICSGAPVYNAQGRFLGVVCVGFRLDTNEFVDSVKQLTGSEVTVFLKDERISTTVAKEDGTRAIGTKAATDVSEVVLSGNVYTGQAKILERDAYTQYTPITGDDGKIIGMLFVGQYLDDATSTIWGFIKTGSLILVLLLTTAVLIIFYIAKRIVAPIGMMVNAANSLAVGDIDVDVRVHTKDEMRKLADAFNGMIENTRKQAKIIETVAEGDLSITIESRSDKDIVNNALILMLHRNNEVLSQIASSSVQVSAGSQQIADGAQTLAQGAIKQAASIEEFSASLSELQKKTQKNAENSAHAQTLAYQSKTMVGESIQYMGEMLNAMKAIDESSQNITQVIKSIDDIAFQTNILALNAAVEAARAGQHGKGFAVVAEEVRNLASKSAEAAKETASLIEGSAERVMEGNHIVEKANTSLESVVVSSDEVSMLIEEVASDSTRQADSIREMSRSIEQISSIVQENSASAQESAAASEEMSAQAVMFNEIAAKFKLKSSHRSLI